jgi:hypothetical protein
MVILFVGAENGVAGIEAFRRYAPKCGLNPTSPLRAVARSLP